MKKGNVKTERQRQSMEKPAKELEKISKAQGLHLKKGRLKTGRTAAIIGISAAKRCLEM